MQPFIVASDLHLSAEASADTVRALAQLLGNHPGHELILAGDVFNLSWEAPGRSAIEAVVALLQAFPSLRATLREQLAAGNRLTFLAGNHDAGLIAPELRTALLDQLELTGAAPLEIAPWFVRRAGVHVEHGHFYDPDNAPAHPLAECHLQPSRSGSRSPGASCGRAARITFRTRMRPRRSRASPRPFACTARARP